MSAKRMGGKINDPLQFWEHYPILMMLENKMGEWILAYVSMTLPR